MFRLKLSGEFPEETVAILKFDKTAWEIFQSTGATCGIEAEAMISVAVAQLIGMISTCRCNV